MSLQSRIVSLRTRHAALDQRIEAEQARPAPDATALRRLKTDKLHIKDELNRLGG